MAIHNHLPPSPALSVCDSLDGIEDLDSFLAAKGPLSNFPTPDLQHEQILASRARCYMTPSLDESLPITIYEETLTTIALDRYSTAAEAFNEKTRACGAYTRDENTTLVNLLARADVSIELLALAYAILDALSVRDTSHLLVDCDADLLLVAALALADIHTNDHPCHLARWSGLITTRTVGVPVVDSMVLAIFGSLGWSIHTLCDPGVVADCITSLTSKQDLRRHH